MSVAYAEPRERFNPYHDSKGKFTSGGATGASGAAGEVSAREFSANAMAEIGRTKGFSLGLDGKPPTASRYISAVEGAERTHPKGTNWDAGIRAHHAEYKSRVRESNGKLFLGGWVDGKGALVLDVSTSFSNKRQAIRWGKDNHQDAIWDNKLGIEIPINARGRNSGQEGSTRVVYVGHEARGPPEADEGRASAAVQADVRHGEAEAGRVGRLTFSAGLDEAERYNPNHDPKTGKFAPKLGGGAAEDRGLRGLNVQECPPVGERSAQTQENIDDLDLLPANCRATLTAGGVEYYLGNTGMTELDDMTYMRGYQPPGWPQGTTADMVPGMCQAAGHGMPTKIILGNGGTGSVSMALHESGHALSDFMTPAQWAEQNRWHKKLYAGLDPYLQQQGSGGKRGSRELFAEAFAKKVKTGTILGGYGFLGMEYVVNPAVRRSHGQGKRIGQDALDYDVWLGDTIKGFKPGANGPGTLMMR